MKRLYLPRVLFTALFLSLTVTWPCSAAFAAKPIIGVSKIVSHPALDAIEKGLQEELKELGVDAQYDFQNANGDLNTAAAIANRFKSAKVSIAVGIATPTSQALVNNLKGTPIVFSGVTDPVKAGLVTNLKQSGGNVTGVSDMTPVKLQLQLLTRIKSIKKLGLITTSSEDNSRVLADEAKKASKELGISVIEATVTTSAEVKQAAQSIVGRVDAIYISTDNTVVSALPSIVEVAMAKKVPVVSADPTSAVGLDILAALGFDYYKIGRATGRVIADILKGKSAGSIPTKFMTDPKDLELLLNADVAKKLGISLSDELLKSASKVFRDGKIAAK